MTRVRRWADATGGTDAVYSGRLAVALYWHNCTALASSR